MFAAALILGVALVAAVIALLAVLGRDEASRRRHLEAERDLSTRLASKETERSALRAILDGVGEGLLAIDRKRHVVLANRRFVEMFGTAGELAGRPLGEVIRVTAVFNACDAALAGRETIERFALVTGVVERRVEIRVLPIDSEQIAAVALFLDITQLERLEQIRRNFISDFTHEVRTPLAGLATAVETYDMSGGAMPPEDEAQLRRIMTRQLKRLQRLVDDLSELSRIEAGDLTLEKREIDLYGMLEDLCEDFADRAAQKELRFSIRGENLAVSADGVRLQQAFSNLFDNAIKYGGSNGTIDVTVKREGGVAAVRVADHGEGIAPEEREAIFRRFYRVDKSRSQDVAGTGLGLAITKHLVLLHRGSIDVESEPGKGATFVVKLPLA